MIEARVLLANAPVFLIEAAVFFSETAVFLGETAVAVNEATVFLGEATVSVNAAGGDEFGVGKVLIEDDGRFEIEAYGQIRREGDSRKRS